MGDSAAGMKDIYWGEFPEAEMDTLLSLLQEEGYEAARKYIDKTLRLRAGDQNTWINPKKPAIKPSFATNIS